MLQVNFGSAVKMIEQKLVWLWIIVVKMMVDEVAYKFAVFALCHFHRQPLILGPPSNPSSDCKDELQKII